MLPELRRDARLYADERIAEAPDEAIAAELTAQYQDVGLVRAEHDLGIGFKVYLIGTALVFQLDGAMLAHSRLDGDRFDMRLRTQLQLAF